jgi:KDO2-lipid IV(A) lauroyltransferase
LEYLAVWLLLKTLGALPKRPARWLAAGFARFLYAMLPRLRRTAQVNLQLAFPHGTEEQRQEIEKRMVRNLGWQAVEFARLSSYTQANINKFVALDGHAHFLEAQKRGKGVLVLTGHIGAWELSSYAHALYGYPMHYMARPIDNALVDALVNRYRCVSGNVPIFKNESARTMLKILKEGGTIGILADQNTLPSEGAFVDFFGMPACTTTGIARVALHTDAAVVPGYALWDEQIGKYRLRFDPPVALVRSQDAERDVLENTQRFASIIEEIVRKYPEQWVWVHARWKVRPEGEPDLYGEVDRGKDASEAKEVDDRSKREERG